MTIFRNRQTTVVQTSGKRIIGSFLLLPGLLSILFGIIVLLAPELLAYLVAIFFIVTGVSMLSAWISSRN